MIRIQFLNYLLESKDSSIITLNNLTDKFFSNCKDEFNFIKNHLDKYGQICDKETFLATFPDFELINVNEKPSYLIGALFEKYKRELLANTFNQVKDKLMSGDIEGAEKLYKEASNSLASGVALSCVDIVQDKSRYNDYIEKTQDFSKFYLTTGFSELDKILGGIDRQEDVGVIVARTNLGKSWILTKMAVAACKQGLNVGVYSGEMSERSVGYRFDTLYGHMNNGALKHGNISVQSEYKKYIDSLGNQGLGSFKILTPQMIGGQATVSILRAFIEKENLDVLYIDQMSLLKDENGAKDNPTKYANISTDIKNLQSIKKMPIIIVSQQNRTKNDGDDDGIDSTQIALSDKIGQDASWVIGITRDKKDDTIMNLHVVKGRDCAVGAKLTYKVDLNKGNFTYIPNEKDNVQTSEEEYQHRYSKVDVSGEEVF